MIAVDTTQLCKLLDAVQENGLALDSETARYFYNALELRKSELLMELRDDYFGAMEA